MKIQLVSCLFIDEGIVAKKDYLHSLFKTV